MTPVVVGVGQVLQRRDAIDPAGGLDAIDLMVSAARAAADDAGAPTLLGRVGAVLVPEGTWPSGDAGRVIAERLGAPAARTTLARIGILQTTLLARAAAAIATGEVDVVLVVGGEARASAVARNRAGLAPLVRTWPPSADVDLAPHGEIVTAVEIERGLAVPAQSYAIQEEAVRHNRSETVDAHRRRLGALWARFSDVAVANPFAWDAAGHDGAEIADPAAPGNRMVATPYTRRHCSQWTVDQAVAILLCSTHVADELGVATDRRVYPVAVVESNAMIPVSARADLHRSPAVAVAGRRLAALTGREPASVEHVDLYSCFPSAVQIQAAELDIDLGRCLTVNGGMTFAGGPLNSAALHAVAAMVDVLRRDPGSSGLVTAVSGMLTKVGLSMWSTGAPPAGFRFADVSDDADAVTSVRQIDPAYAGMATVDGSTVAYDRDGPAVAVVVATEPGGRRVVATSTDQHLAARFAADPPTGEQVRVDGGQM